MVKPAMIFPGPRNGCGATETAGAAYARADACRCPWRAGHAAPTHYRIVFEYGQRLGQSGKGEYTISILYGVDSVNERFDLHNGIRLGSACCSGGLMSARRASPRRYEHFDDHCRADLSAHRGLDWMRCPTSLGLMKFQSQRGRPRPGRGDGVHAGLPQGCRYRPVEDLGVLALTARRCWISCGRYVLRWFRADTAPEDLRGPLPRLEAEGVTSNVGWMPVSERGPSRRACARRD